MSHVLLIGNNNWSDEIELDFFAAMPVERWESLQERTKKAFEAGIRNEFYIGTNEAVELNSYKEWRKQFTVKQISPEEYSMIKNLFGSKSNGFGAGDGLIFGPSEREAD